MNMIDMITSIQYKAIESRLSGSFNGLSIARVIHEIMIIIVMAFSKYTDLTILARKSLQGLLCLNI